MRDPVRTPLVAGLAGLLALIGVGIVALDVAPAGRPDSATLARLVSADHRGIPLAEIASIGNPATYLLIGGMLLVIAIVRARPWAAISVAVLLPATAITTQVLKVLLETDRSPGALGLVDPQSWPSGHSTAAMTLAICAVIVTPRPFRVPVALAGVAVACAVGGSLIALGHHYPSDVVGGFLVAGTGTAFTLAAVASLRGARILSRT